MLGFFCFIWTVYSVNRFILSYNNIISSLSKILSRPHYIDLCESTRTLACQSQEHLQDIYDGRIWKEFLMCSGTKFLKSAFCYGFLLNVDWFQPFDHHMYSVGVIYLVLLNLPRAIRYKRENVIVVGIIPGPSEPSPNINLYLSPLVSDLIDLWNLASIGTKKEVRENLNVNYQLATDLWK